MNHDFFGKRRSVFFCILMIIVQLTVMSGCAGKDLYSVINEPIIDNDLVVDAAYKNIHFKVGESWVKEETEEGMYFYPGTDILYFVGGYGVFNDRVDEDNYIGYALQFFREGETLDNVLVTERMVPYTTADGRDAFISRLRIYQSDDSIDLIHDADLLIIPDNKFFVLFTVAYQADQTVPLDIREVVDTATFDLDPVISSVIEGFSFYDEKNEVAIKFTDSQNFVTYLDPDNRDGYYVYGTYSFYMGDEAIDQVDGMKEYGLTESEIRETMPNMLGQYSFLEDDPDKKGVDEDDFIAIVFDIKGFVDEEGNEGADDFQEFTALYIGLYIEEYEALDMLNCNTFRWYKLEKEEN